MAYNKGKLKFPLGIYKNEFDISLTEFKLDKLKFHEFLSFFKFIIGGIFVFFKILFSKSISPDDLVLYKPTLLVLYFY